jgi:hypothetical protein
VRAEDIGQLFVRGNELRPLPRPVLPLHFFGRGKGSLEWILDSDTEVLLAWIQVLRPNPGATAALGGRHNHPIAKVQTMGRPNLDRTPNQFR